MKCETPRGREHAAAPADAFREIFEANVRAVARTLRYLGVPSADVPDVTQEVFIVVDRRRVDFEQRALVSTWIRQICVLSAFAHRRKIRRRRENTADVAPEPVVDADQPACLEASRQREDLRRALEALDEAQRSVVLLHDLEQRAMREVAELVGCPVQTAYSRRNAALARLRHELSKSLPDEP